MHQGEKEDESILYSEIFCSEKMGLVVFPCLDYHDN
jgi:hypothetical protein